MQGTIRLPGAVFDGIWRLLIAVETPGHARSYTLMRAPSAGAAHYYFISGPLGYPPTDPNHTTVGPAPNTFSGMRALNFVLENTENIDKTILINVKVARIDKPGEKGNAKR